MSDVTVSDLDLFVGLVTRPSNAYHWGDYLVFALTLVVSAIIGLYFGIKSGRRMSVRDLLLGGGNLNLYTVAMSLVATVTSTIFVLGVPSRTYFGGEWPLYVALAFIPATVVTVHIFIPIFHKLGVTSVYEYVGLRFNNIVRFMTALVFVVMMNLTQALTIYTPAVGFALVADVSLEVSILAAGLVCTFYTALGGLRAVIVTDIFQIITIVFGTFGLLIKGAVDAGGLNNVFKRIGGSYRLQMWSIKWSSAGTYTFWSQLLGGTVIFIGLFGTNQTTVQRYCSVKKCKDAQKAAYVALVFYIIIWVLVLLVGIVIYAFYYTCDPLILQVIDNPDQILPLFVMDSLGHIHGLSGLFSAAVFSAVLSSVSSGINSMSAVTLQDIIKPLYHRRHKKELSEYYCRSIARILALFYGTLAIGLSYIPVKYGTYILNLDMTFSTYGVLGGPIIGVFVLGTMFPLANSLGSGIGLVVGTLIGIWMWIGRLLCRNSHRIKTRFETPSQCRELYNITEIRNPGQPLLKSFPAETLYTDCPLQPMYDVSYLWYGVIGAGCTIIVGLFVSMISGAHGGKRVSPDLLCWGRIKRQWRRVRDKTGHESTLTPTVEPTSTGHPVVSKKSSPTDRSNPPITPPTGQILLLKSDSQQQTNIPSEAGQPITCYLEDDDAYPEVTERVLYQDNEVIPTVDGSLSLQPIQSSDGVLFQDDGAICPNSGERVLYQDADGIPALSGSLSFQPVHSGDGVLFQDSNVLYPDSSERVLSQDTGPVTTVAGGVPLEPIHSRDGVLFQGAHANQAYVTDAPDDGDVMVLYQPEGGDHVIIADPNVIQVEALPSTPPVLHQPPDQSPEGDTFPGVLYPDTPVLRSPEAAHLGTDSQLVQRHNTSGRQALWS